MATESPELAVEALTLAARAARAAGRLAVALEHITEARAGPRRSRVGTATTPVRAWSSSPCSQTWADSTRPSRQPKTSAGSATRWSRRTYAAMAAWVLGNLAFLGGDAAAGDRRARPGAAPHQAGGRPARVGPLPQGVRQHARGQRRPQRGRPDRGGRSCPAARRQRGRPARARPGAGGARPQRGRSRARAGTGRPRRRRLVCRRTPAARPRPCAIGRCTPWARRRGGGGPDPSRAALRGGRCLSGGRLDAWRTHGRRTARRTDQSPTETRLQREVAGGLPALRRRRGRRGGSRPPRTVQSNSARSSKARSIWSSDRWWATVTCGWKGNSTSTSSGPERTAAASCSVCEMPLTRLTKTTGETGRNVPVPRRCTSNDGPGLGDLGEVLLDGREVVCADLGRRDERDVGGDQRGGGVEVGPVVLELGGPGLGDRQGDSDDRHPNDLTDLYPR